MSGSSTRSLIISLAVTVIVTVSVAASAQSDLPKSRMCTAYDGGWSPDGGAVTTGQITMNNGGGWCGDRLGIKYGSAVFGGTMRLTQQPTHGQVSIAFHQDATDVSYKPNPGYSGPDDFAVLVEFYNINKPYHVVVQ